MEALPGFLATLRGTVAASSSLIMFEARSRDAGAEEDCDGRAGGSVELCALLTAAVSPVLGPVLAGSAWCLLKLYFAIPVNPPLPQRIRIHGIAGAR